MKRILIYIISFYIFYSILFLFGTEFDIDFYLKMFPLTFFGSVVVGFLLSLQKNPKETKYINNDIKVPNLIYKDYDIKVVNLHFENINSIAFDYEVFSIDKFSIYINFSSVDWIGKPVDFTVCRNKPTNPYIWHIEVDHDYCRDWYMAKNKELEDFLIDLWRKDEYHVKGLYDCLFDVRDYHSLQMIFDKVSDWTKNIEIETSIHFYLTELDSFVQSLCNMEGIPAELKTYFKSDFVNDILNIKCLEQTKKGNDIIFYRSGLLLKIDDKDFMYFNKFENSLRCHIY